MYVYITFDLITLSRNIQLLCALVHINLFIWKDDLSFNSTTEHRGHTHRLRQKGKKLKISRKKSNEMKY